jgi:hypothetical protein
MYAVYVADRAFQKIDDFSHVSRPVMAELFEQLCLLERNGAPPKSLVISDLFDSQGQAVDGYLIEMGQFSLVVSFEEKNKIIVWEVQVRLSNF